MDKRIYIAITFLFLLFLTFGESLKAQDVESVIKSKPVTFRGNLGLGGWYYNSNGITGRYKPFSWFLNGSPTLTVYGIVMPFSFTFSEQQRSFSQPFNQWGVSPYYKWITVHAGYRNLKFSEFTLNGHTILGAGVELKPGKFRFSAVYGRLRKAVDPGELEEGLDYFNYPPSYKRTGYSVKIGVGSQASFVDLVFFQAKDDPNSVSSSAIDSLGITPGINSVIALNSKFLITKKLQFFGEIAGSTAARDRFSENYVLENKFGNNVLEFLGFNTSSAAGIALQTGLSYNFNSASIKLTYRRVERQFASYGLFFINNDLEQLTLAPTIRLLKGKLNTAASFGVMRDNLDKLKAVNTFRTVGSLNVNYMPGQKYQLGFQYSNYGTSQNKEQVFVNDSFLVSLVNQNIGLYNTFFFKSETRQKSVNFSVFYNDFNDRNEFTGAYSNSKNLSLRGSFQDQLLSSGWSWQAGLSYNRIENRVFASNLLGPQLGLGYAPREGKLSARVNTSVQFNEQSGKTGSLFNLSLSGAWKITKRQALQFNAIFSKNNTGINVGRAFSESRLFLNYNYTFGS